MAPDFDAQTYKETTREQWQAAADCLPSSIRMRVPRILDYSATEMEAIWIPSSEAIWCVWAIRPQKQHPYVSIIWRGLHCVRYC
jgi:hypothetical protein